MNQTHFQPEDVLRNVFGYQSFRPLQKKCIESALNGENVLLVMPTGGGKSLCYQIPALIMPGVSIVVSPLIALMKDQLDELRRLELPAAVLNSSLSLMEYREVQNKVLAGEISILYVSPETLLKDQTRDLLSHLDMGLLIIDEAHCISEWGHDFRPEYRRIHELSQELNPHAVMAVTATATPRVRQDILASLQMKDAQVLVASFNRTNLFYEVVAKSDPLHQVLDFLKRFRHQSGIIYCLSRKQVDKLTDELSRLGFKAASYHAGLNEATREKHQEAFLNDEIEIIVATIAFGMGVNKPNVRFVIHYDLPKNIESYYQETGRAGRDGLPAHCLTLFGYGDIQKVNYFIEQKGHPEEKAQSRKQLKTLLNYLDSVECRRRPLLQYFGDDYTVESCGQCDNCVRRPEELVDLTEPARLFLSAVVQTGQRFGRSHVVDILMGKQTEKVERYDQDHLKIFGNGKDYSVKQWSMLADQLLKNKLLSKTDDYGVLRIQSAGLNVLAKGQTFFGLSLPEKKTKKRLTSKTSKVSTQRIPTVADDSLLGVLKKWRKEQADGLGMPAYTVLTDKTLLAIDEQRPRTMDELINVFGFGPRKVAQFGEAVLEMVETFQTDSSQAF